MNEFNLKDKKVLVVGVAKSGIAAAEFLVKKGAEVILNDIKNEKDLANVLDKIDFKVDIKLGVCADEFVKDSDLIVVSPGVPTDLNFVTIARQNNIKVISEVELAYLFSKAPIIGITGTNGKTTTTSLVGELFKKSGRGTVVVGNIGLPMTSQVDKVTAEDVIVAELSSFQLETIEKFKPKVSAVLNFTPDHLNRHKTFENYVEAKCRIFENQDENDYVVLNYDDEGVRKIKDKVKAQILWFSKTEGIERGAYCKEGKIFIRNNRQEIFIANREDIFIPGDHNLENALAGVCMAWVMGVKPEDIAYVLKNFKGVEHRIEFVDEIDGIRYINDSKGTNVDAAIKAIQAMKAPTVLIAGGYDKGVEFDELIKSFTPEIKHLILMGVTANKIEDTARKYNFVNITKVKDMHEAVVEATKLLSGFGNVLLSPACASWDMFKSFEHRGDVFKEEVKKIRG